MESKFYHIITYGCQMNEADSETLAGILQQRGYAHTSEVEKSDIILLITCAVRDHAEKKIYGKLGELFKLKKSKPSLIIGIGGCMTQQTQIAKKLQRTFPKLDIIFGTHNLHEFAEILDQVELTNTRVFKVHNIDGLVVEDLPKHYNDKHKAFINITFGCNNFCTYCIVPHVRGRERSRKPEDIEQEVRQLVDQGYREVTLLGQNVNSYGKDLSLEIRFEDLLEKLAQIKNLKRIRFTTSHPKDMSDDLIDVISKYDNICNHIHLPVQAGSNSVLKAMNRKYTRESYLELVNKIKNKIPNCSLTTDIIVGFPGETDEDFQQTLNVVNEVKYDAAFTFVYSPREGTPAAKFTNQVPLETQKARLQTLINVVQKHMLDNNQEYIGKIIEVMVDGTSKKDEQVLSGRSDTNKLVHFRGNFEPGDIVKLEIYKVTTFVLWGRLLD